ncbi:uncharacterized protein LOC129874897 isoform X1 [Solanum dulcamara]|uniref:uncharacterized protein LOC129874897 isoform X1 n=1 Tax=Solanum dulcamara TaxID=45834 RepID=UPI0024866534|nr:uncharacterized protein LOC129874897 isoform X1 [Solanum dulcamara]
MLILTASVTMSDENPKPCLSLPLICLQFSRKNLLVINFSGDQVSVAIGIGTFYVKVDDDECGVSRDGLVLMGEKYGNLFAKCWTAINFFYSIDVAEHNFFCLTAMMFITWTDCCSL